MAAKLAQTAQQVAKIGAFSVSLKPFFTYYGGKWRSAPRLYPPPVFGTIVEPFAGSAGFSLRWPDRNVILCDSDPVVASLWLYLTRVTASEILHLPDLAEGQTTNNLGCAPEAKSLIGFWLNKGSARPEIRPSSWMQKWHPNSQWGPAIRQRIAAQLSRIRHWTVRCADYQQEDHGPATYFIDPPYQIAGARYRCGSRDINYAALGDWCRSLRGQVIVCENEGADWLPFADAVAVKGQRAGCRSEVVWLNQ